MIYIMGFEDMLARNAPVAAITMLNAMIFFAPNLSERNPVGIEKII